MWRGRESDEPELVQIVRQWPECPRHLMSSSDGCRQSDHDLCSHAYLALEVDAATVLFHDPVAQRKPEAHALANRLG